ncbi:hypothetical protein RB195_024753 [Necator americanus]|uniref:Reverse transcriptase domain-containing protein n=1 Tax=Necator americanus TaxID=51031 RepID=A0ABR1EPJ6_NECAM
MAPRYLREDGHVIPNALPSEVRHAIMLLKNRTSPGLDRIKPEHLKYLPPVLITHWRSSSLDIFRNAKFLNNGKPARPCCFIRGETHETSATVVQSGYCL